MKLQHLVYNILVINMAYAETSEENRTESVKRIVLNLNDRITQCSGYLSNIVQNLCANEYTIVRKRDTSSLMFEKLIPKDLQNHMNKQRLLEVERWRRVRRQIADECCNNSCSVGELSGYCSSTSELLKAHPELLDSLSSEVK